MKPIFRQLLLHDKSIFYVIKFNDIVNFTLDNWAINLDKNSIFLLYAYKIPLLRRCFTGVKLNENYQLPLEKSAHWGNFQQKITIFGQVGVTANKQKLLISHVLFMLLQWKLHSFPHSSRQQRDIFAYFLVLGWCVSPRDQDFYLLKISFLPCYTNPLSVSKHTGCGLNVTVLWHDFKFSVFHKSDFAPLGCQ